MSTCMPLLYLPSGSYDLTTSNALVADGTAAFNTEKVTSAAVDITFTGFTGGGAPTCTIFLERIADLCEMHPNCDVRVSR